MFQAKCLIGNSSSAIREGEFMEVPSVNIGTRQNSRLRGNNIFDCDYSEKRNFFCNKPSNIFR